MSISSLLKLNLGLKMPLGSLKAVFIKVLQHFIKSHLKFCLISQISFHGLWHVGRLHHENILKNFFSNTAGKMKNLVSMNTPYMLVITRGLSLNGWIKNENMQLKVLKLAFTANVV